PPFAAALRLGCWLRSRPVLAAASPALIVQQKLPALTHLLTLARGRGRSERVCDGPTGAAPILFHLIRCRGGADRPHHRGRPGRPALVRYTALFRSPPFAAALRLGCWLRSRPVLAAASPALIVQQKLPALTHLLTLARGRGRSERVCDGPT